VKSEIGILVTVVRGEGRRQHDSSLRARALEGEAMRAFSPVSPMRFAEYVND